MWYAAHLLLYLKFVDGPQEPHLVWENIYLLEAVSVDDAFAEADRLGAAEEASDGSGRHTYAGRPCRWVYKGVRRMAECIDFEGGPPRSGKEVTYLAYYLENETAIGRMLNKQSAKLLLDGDDIL